MHQEQAHETHVLAKSKPLNFLWLELTKACNLECVHCYAESNPRHPLVGSMTFDDWKRVLREGRDLDCSSVQFIGGEPTMHPNFMQLVREASELGYKYIEVFSNGTHLGDELLIFFKSHDIHLAISWYACSPEVHDRITGRAGSYLRTMAGISRAVELGIPVRVGVIEMDLNRDDLKGATDVLRELGVTSYRVDRVRGLGRGEKLVNASDPYLELCGACWRGKLCVNSDGDAYPCVFSSFYTLGNVRDGLAALVGSASLRSFQAGMEQRERGKLSGTAEACDPRDDDDCRPAINDCNPDCAPACSPCVPDVRGISLSGAPRVETVIGRE